MMNSFAIYLAGTIKKGHEDLNESHWGKEEIDQIRAAFYPTKVQLLNPAIRFDNLQDQPAVLGRDLSQVFVSDAVFVDARERRGLGVGAEMCFAKMLSIPVVTLAPLESHYHKSTATVLDRKLEGFIHPFVNGLSDVIVETIEEGINWMKQLKQHKIKGKEALFSYIKYYGNTYLLEDSPFYELLEENKELRNRLELALGEKLQSV